MNHCMLCGWIITLSVLTLPGCGKAAKPATEKKRTPEAVVSSQAYTSDMLCHHWIFDGDRFNEFFDAMMKARIQYGGTKLSFLEKEQRRQHLRRRIDQMPAYDFSKINDSDILLTITGEKLPKKEKPLKSETRVASGVQFSFVDDKNDRCEVLFIDRDHITFTIHTAGRTTVLPLIRTVTRSPPSK